MTRSQNEVLLCDNIAKKTLNPKSQLSFGIAAAVLLGMSSPNPTFAADDLEERLIELEKAYTELLLRDREKDQVITDLQNQVRNLQRGKRSYVPSDQAHGDHDHGSAPEADHSDHKTAASHEHDDAHSESPDLFVVDVPGGQARLSGIYLDTAFAAGLSTEEGETLEALQGGDHDPRQNGFTVRTVDLSIAGGFDPYFDAFANVAFFLDPEGETVIELEEAFLQTQSPAGIPELRAGQFFTEFGLSNPVHIHDKDWLDQPFVLTRFFGPDGLRGPGARVAWRSAETSPFTALVGVQNARGETAASFLSSDELFEELPIGGVAFAEQDVDGLDDLLYHARLSKVFERGENSFGVGISGLYGPNASGDDGETYIIGGDVFARIALQGEQALTLQGEFLYRDYKTDNANEADGFAGEDFEDYGFYAQTLYDFNAAWSAGLRLGYGSGDGESVGDFGDRDADPFRADRYRLSPLLVWNFAPTARLSLQYNYDDSDFLSDDDAHSVWLGLNWAIGAGRRAELGSGPGHAHHKH